MSSEAVTVPRQFGTIEGLLMDGSLGVFLDQWEKNAVCGQVSLYLLFALLLHQ